MSIILSAQNSVPILLPNEKIDVFIEQGLIEADGTLEIAEVLSLLSDSLSVGPMTYSSEHNTYWAKLILNNNTQRDRDWVLNFKNWSFVDLYIIDPTTHAVAEHRTTGHKLDFQYRDYGYANENYILLDIPKGKDHEYIVRLKSTYNNYLRPSDLSFKVIPRSILDQQVRGEERIMWMFLSIYLVLFLYNFFIFLSVRDISYVFYLCRAICVAYLMVNNSGLIMPLMSWIPGFPNISSYLESLASGLNMIFLILFTMSFLQTKHHIPRLNKVLQYSIYAIGLLVIGVFTRQPVFLIVTLLLSFFLMGLISTVGVVSYFKKVPSSKYYVLAYFFAVVGVIVLTLVYSGVIAPTNFFTIYPTHIGYALELLFFSFALADKINVLKSQNEFQKELIIDQLKEKEQFQANVNKELEQKVQERTQEIEAEQAKSEKLLLNILPAETAEELKKYGKAKSQYHDDVTIMLTDFTNFTKISSTLGPEKLVSELDDLFQHFDDIMDNNNLEKIKTIGDAYMVAAGLHKGKGDHGYRMVKSAIEIINYLKERNTTHDITWNIRIGIHTGPVVSGVVGKKKFTFDTWGDTVNVASRLENTSETNRINLSKDTFELVKSKISAYSRGMIEVKGKGVMEMFFVDI